LICIETCGKVNVQSLRRSLKSGGVFLVTP